MVPTIDVNSSIVKIVDIIKVEIYTIIRPNLGFLVKIGLTAPKLIIYAAIKFGKLPVMILARVEFEKYGLKYSLFKSLIQIIMQKVEYLFRLF